MAIWPATLPKPRLAGYGGEPAQAFKRTDFDNGPARQRQIFTATPETVNATFRFTGAQMAIFRSYWKNDIGMGSGWFSMELDIGDGFAVYDLRFSRVYKQAALPGMKWEIQAVMEVRDA